MNVVFAIALSGAAVIGAGVLLTTSADAIAERTRIGRAWVGAVLLAGATSLPELATDVAAVRIGAPDLAIGDLFGSSMANMLILAALDLGWRQRALLRSAALDHALAACLAISSNAIAAAFLLVAPTLTVIGVSPGSLFLAGLYVVGARAIHRATAKPSEAESRPERGRLAGPVLQFVAGAVIILLTAPLFARSAEEIANASGLGSTFVGTVLLGFATSLPELVSCLTALRMGALDLAVGNLFGSNAFNMAILLALDVAQPDQSIFAVADPAHAVTGLFAVALMGLGLAAIVYRAERRFRMIEPDSLAMVALYAVGLAMLYSKAVPP